MADQVTAPQRHPDPNPWDLGLCYVTWQSRIEAADTVKVASQLTSRQGNYPGLSGQT